MDSYRRSSSSSTGKRSRLLEVKIKSANLNTKSRGRFYVKLWILNQQDSKLRTEKVYPTGSGSTLMWNQKFVFAVPRTLIVDKKISSVWFEIFRVRKGFPDKSLGKAEGKFELESTPKEETIEDEVNYDTENKEEYFFTDEETDHNGEEEEEDMDSCELKGSGRVGVGKGELNVEMVVWKGFLLGVGECKWRRWAMEYDEFMGLDEGSLHTNKKKKKKKSQFFMCFRNATVKD